MSRVIRRASVQICKSSKFFIFMIPSQHLEQLELLERLERSLFNHSLPKPSSSYPVVVEPEKIAAAGFGEVVFALDLAVPPAAGEDIGAGELVADYGFIAELGAQTGQRAIGGVEIARRSFNKQMQLLTGGSAGFGA